MNNCLNCNREIPENKRFCNESCVREYFKDRFKNNPKKRIIPNSCKNCFKVIPEGLQFCSKSCMEELKFKQKNPSLFGISLKTKDLEYVEVDNLFTKYANANQLPKDRCEICGKKIADYQRFCSRECIKENERRQKTRKKTGYEKIIDDNYELAKEYIETVKNLRQNHPHLRKFTFREWLKRKQKLEVKNL